MVKAVLFDVDGTLLDTTEYIYQSFEHSLRFHKHEALPRETLRRMIGKSLEDGYREFTTLDDVIHLMDTHKAFQAANAGLSKPYPHVLSTLEHIREKGISIAAVTSRSRNSVIHTLELAELFPLIDYIVGIEDVESPKPDPEPVMKALNYFSLKPTDAIMVGDSDVDVFAGHAAGTKTVGVSYGFHGKLINDAKPDFVIDDIRELLRLI